MVLGKMAHSTSERHYMLTNMIRPVHSQIPLYYSLGPPLIYNRYRAPWWCYIYYPRRTLRPILCQFLSQGLHAVQDLLLAQLLYHGKFVLPLQANIAK